MVMKNWQPLLLGPAFCLCRGSVVVGWLARPGGEGSEGVKEKMPSSMVSTEATYRHGQQSFGIVLQREVLVREALGAIDAHGARAVAVQKVAALAHELGYL